MEPNLFPDQIQLNTSNINYQNGFFLLKPLKVRWRLPKLNLHGTLIDIQDKADCCVVQILLLKSVALHYV